MPELKFFQKVGRDFLAKRTRALLADEMRLGKTVQVITACQLVKAKNVLVVCPAVARGVWRSHFKEWAPEINYQVMSYDEARAARHLESSKRSHWSVLVVDEVHFTKNIQAARTNAIWAKGGLAWYAHRVWALSGTPAPNHVGELWPMLKAFGVIKMTYNQFINHFCRVDGTGRVLGTDTRRVQELRDIMKPVTLRRLQTGVAPELDKLTVETYPVEANTSYLRAAYPADHDFKLRFLAEQSAQLSEELDRLPNDKERLTYLAQFAEHYAALRRITALLKAPAVADLIKFEIGNGLVKKLVVFGYHRDAMTILQRELTFAGIKAVLVFGGTPQKKKEAAVKSFSRKGGAQVFIGNILSAGTAIDLSAANEGLLLERDWVPGNNAQAMHRMGGFKQKRPITVRDIVLEGSIDELIRETVMRKTLELKEVFD